MIPRIRTLPSALEEIKAVDPNTSVNLHALRRWVDEGKISCTKSGRYVFVDLNEVENYLSGIAQ